MVEVTVDFISRRRVNPTLLSNFAGLLRDSGAISASFSILVDFLSFPFVDPKSEAIERASLMQASLMCFALSFNSSAQCNGLRCTLAGNEHLPENYVK